MVLKTFKSTDFNEKIHLRTSFAFKKGPILVRFSKKNEKINIPEQDNVDNKKYKLTSCEIPIILVNKNQEYPFMFGQSKAKILSTFNNKYIIDNEYYNDKYSRYFPKRKWL